MKRIAPLLLLIFLVGCSPVRGFLESEFTLAPESPLPSWYPSLPAGVQRDQVTITLQYWSSPFDVDNTVFTVKKGWWTLYNETGRYKWEPKYWSWAQKDWPKRSNPGFVLVTINDKTEVVGHFVKGPIFQITSEAVVNQTIGGVP